MLKILNQNVKDPSSPASLAVQGAPSGAAAGQRRAGGDARAAVRSSMGWWWGHGREARVDEGEGSDL